MAPDVARHVEELTSSAALLADQERIRTFKLNLGKLGDDTMPGDFDFDADPVLPGAVAGAAAGSGLDQEFKSALDDYFPEDDAPQGGTPETSAQDLIGEMDDLSRDLAGPSEEDMSSMPEEADQALPEEADQALPEEADQALPEVLSEQEDATLPADEALPSFVQETEDSATIDIFTPDEAEQPAASPETAGGDSLPWDAAGTDQDDVLKAEDRNDTPAFGEESSQGNLSSNFWDRAAGTSADDDGLDDIFKSLPVDGPKADAEPESLDIPTFGTPEAGPKADAEPEDLDIPTFGVAETNEQSPETDNFDDLFGDKAAHAGTDTGAVLFGDTDADPVRGKHDFPTFGQDETPAQNPATEEIGMVSFGEEPTLPADDPDFPTFGDDGKGPDDGVVLFGQTAEKPVGRADTGEDAGGMDALFADLGDDPAPRRSILDELQEDAPVIGFGQPKAGSRDDDSWIPGGFSADDKPLGDAALPGRASRFATPNTDGDDEDADFGRFGKPKQSEDQGFGSSPPEPSPFGNMDDLPGFGGPARKDREPSIPGYSDDFEDEPNYDESPIRMGTGDEGIPQFSADDEDRQETVRSHSQATFEEIMGIGPDQDAQNTGDGSAGDDTESDKEEDEAENRTRKRRKVLAILPFPFRKKKIADQPVIREEPVIAAETAVTERGDEPEINLAASEGTEINVGGDEEMAKTQGEVAVKKKKKSKLLPILFGSVAAVILGVFVLDTMEIVDVPGLGPDRTQTIIAAPPVTAPVASTTAPVAPVPDTEVASVDDPSTSTAPTFGTNDEAPLFEDTPPTAPVETDVTVAEAPIDGSDPLIVPDADPASASVASQIERDRTVAADPAIEDLFDSGTTVTVSEDPRAGVEENVLRIAESLDAQATEIQNVMAQMGEFERAMLERDEAMRQRDESIAAALEIAERAESIALAQNEVLVRMVETEEEMNRSSEIMQDLSRRIAIVESNDTVTIEVDRLTNELREQKRDIEAIARSMIANNAALEQRKRELEAAAALAAQPPAPPPSRPVPQGAGTVYGTGGDVVLEVPGANAPAPVVPMNAKRGDTVPGYGVIEEISDLEGGDRLIITENGSFVVN